MNAPSRLIDELKWVKNALGQWIYEVLDAWNNFFGFIAYSRVKNSIKLNEVINSN